MKFLIVGLGNIGAEYDNTRHNIGFEVLDMLASQMKISFELKKLGMVAEGRIKNQQIVLLKPTTYMNLSGKAIQYYMQEHKITTEQLLVVTDDLSLELGTIRMRLKGSHGGHNGLRDTEEKLLTQNYNRLRFGIGNQFHKSQQTDFVLGKWKADETTTVEQSKIKATLAIESFVLEGISKAMTKYNG